MPRQELAAALFHSSPLAIGIARLDDGCLVEVNEPLEKLLECPREEALGKSLAQLGVLHEPADYERLVGQASRGERIVGFPVPLRSRGGKTRDMHLSAHLVTAGETRYLAHILSDAVDVTGLEHALWERERMLGQTVAALAQDLSQPLEMVGLHAEAALRMLRAGNPQLDELKHALEKSVQEAQRAGKVVQDLLAFLRHGDLDALKQCFAQLTPREREVLGLALAGYNNKAIGKKLRISFRTVEIHRSRILQKTGAANMLELARLAMMLPSSEEDASE